MPSVKYSIELSDSDRNMLHDLVTKGNTTAKAILRANILLASDKNNKRHMTVQKVRTSYANNGLTATIQRKKRITPPVAPKVTGDVEAHIVALACGNPPKGYRKWSVRLIAERCVELNYVESISHMTISRVLKKTNLNRT